MVSRDAHLTRDCYIPNFQSSCAVLSCRGSEDQKERTRKVAEDRQTLLRTRSVGQLEINLDDACRRSANMPCTRYSLTPISTTVQSPRDTQTASCRSVQHSHKTARKWSSQIMYSIVQYSATIQLPLPLQPPLQLRRRIFLGQPASHASGVSCRVPEVACTVCIVCTWTVQYLHVDP